MQAIYHGKPVVAMPFFGDQPNNADKMVAKVGSPQYCLKTLHLGLQVHIAVFGVGPRTGIALPMQSCCFMQCKAVPSLGYLCSAGHGGEDQPPPAGQHCVP